jgi:hypothetical protein
VNDFIIIALFIFSSQLFADQQELNYTVGSNQYNSSESRNRPGETFQPGNTIIDRINAKADADQKRIQAELKDRSADINTELNKRMQSNISERERIQLINVKNFLKTQNLNYLPISLKVSDVKTKIALGNLYSNLFAVNPINDTDSHLRIMGFGVVRDADNSYAAKRSDYGDAQFKLGLKILDLILHLNPYSAPAINTFEALTGLNPVDQAPISTLNRAVAIAGLLANLAGEEVSLPIELFSNILTMYQSDLNLGELASNLAGVRSWVSTTLAGQKEEIINEVLESASHLRSHERSSLFGEMISGYSNDAAQKFKYNLYLSYVTMAPVKLYAVMDSFETPQALTYWTRIATKDKQKKSYETEITKAFGRDKNQWVEIEVPVGTALYEGLSPGFKEQGNADSDQVYIGAGKIQNGWIKTVQNFN